MRLCLLLFVLVPSVAAAADGPLLSIDLEETPWKYFDGDNPEFARADFDDSAWPQVAVPRYRNNYRWFRRQVTIPEWANTDELALLTSNLPVLAVYLNGVEIGSSGSFTDFRNYSGAEPRGFEIPRGLLRPGSAATVAVRSYNPFLHRQLTIIRPEGGFRIVSRALAPADPGQMARASHWVRFGPAVFLAGIFLSMSVVALAAWRFAGRRQDLLWFAVLCFSWFLDAISPVFPVTQWRHYLHSGISYLALFDPLPLLACFTFAALGIRSRWPYLLVAGCWASLIAFGLAAQDKHTYRWLYYAIVILLPASVFTVLLAQWLRERFRSSQLEPGLGFVLLVKAGSDTLEWGFRFAATIRGEPNGGIASRVAAGPFLVDTGMALSLVIAVVLLTMLIRAVSRQREEQRRVTAELEAARTVQQLMIPATSAEGIEAVYLPAAEVGGDFWHLLDGKLVVVGDVSGKGLKAAMIVSLITGMLDRRHAQEPAALLAELNDALAARLDGGFVTCTICRLEPDGRITLANAGHPSPYLDGREVDLPAGLPLGFVSGAEYAEITLPAGRLTFISDGVIEAANAGGELFGFERAAAIAMNRAAEIAEAAKAWGQNDDITVVTVARTAA